MDTAHAIAKYHNLKVHPVPGIKEIHVGEIEGTSLDQFGSTSASSWWTGKHKASQSLLQAEKTWANSVTAYGTPSSRS